MLRNTISYTTKIFNKTMVPRNYSNLPIRKVETVDKIFSVYKKGFIGSTALFTVFYYFTDESKFYYPFSSAVTCTFGGILTGFFWPIVVPCAVANILDEIYIKYRR